MKILRNECVNKKAKDDARFKEYMNKTTRQRMEEANKIIQAKHEGKNLDGVLKEMAEERVMSTLDPQSQEKETTA